MSAHYRRSIILFLMGAFERLYAGSTSRLPKSAFTRPHAEPFVYLCEGRHLYWAIVSPTGPYEGRIAWSNLFRPGTLVRSKKSWRYAGMRPSADHPRTIVSPRYLRVLWLPPTPPAARVGNRPRFLPLREFSLAA